MKFEEAVDRFVKYCRSVEQVYRRRGYKVDQVLRMSVVMYCYTTRMTPENCVEVLLATWNYEIKQHPVENGVDSN